MLLLRDDEEEGDLADEHVSLLVLVVAALLDIDRTDGPSATIPGTLGRIHKRRRRIR